MQILGETLWEEVRRMNNWWRQLRDVDLAGMVGFWRRRYLHAYQNFFSRYERKSVDCVEGPAKMAKN